MSISAFGVEDSRISKAAEPLRTKGGVSTNYETPPVSLLKVKAIKGKLAPFKDAMLAAAKK
jgi:hypothetical protein